MRGTLQNHVTTQDHMQPNEFLHLHCDTKLLRRPFPENHVSCFWIGLMGSLKASHNKANEPHFLHFLHVYLNSVQQMVSGELAGEGLQTGFSRHGLPPQRAPLHTVYPLSEHLSSVQRMVSGGYCEGLFPDTVCWTRLRNAWFLRERTFSRNDVVASAPVPTM